MRIFLIILLSTVFIGLPSPLPLTQTDAFRGAPIALTVQLTRQNGSPIDDATVLFFHETQNLFLGTAQTNVTGHAQFVWQVPSAHELGFVSLNATFRGDPERFLLPSMVSIPLTVFARLDNIINITDTNGNPIHTSVNLGQKLLFNILIQDDHTIPLEGISVQLLISPNQLIAEGVTTQNGTVHFSCILNHTITNEVTFLIRSLNHGFYNGTENRFRISIRNTSVQLIGLPAFWLLRCSQSISGRLCQNNGEVIANATIELLSERGLLIGCSVTDSEGRFIFDLCDQIETIQTNRFLIFRYNGGSGYETTEAVVGIISGLADNPFSQFIEIITPIDLTQIIHQLNIIIVSCLAIGTTVITLKMKQTTRRIVSH
ncbi:MAG: hypothetical protein ACFFBU_04555 [Promethearchaeota archaeon]